MYFLQFINVKQQKNKEIHKKKTFMLYKLALDMVVAGVLVEEVVVAVVPVVGT